MWMPHRFSSIVLTMMLRDPLTLTGFREYLWSRRCRLITCARWPRVWRQRGSRTTQPRTGRRSCDGERMTVPECREPRRERSRHKLKKSKPSERNNERSDERENGDRCNERSHECSDEHIVEWSNERIDERLHCVYSDCRKLTGVWVTLCIGFVVKLHSALIVVIQRLIFNFMKQV